MKKCFEAIGASTLSCPPATKILLSSKEDVIFANGTGNDWLVLAGGTNFPDSVPWKGGTKQWHKTAYIKQAGSADQEWIVLPNTLPHPLVWRRVKRRKCQTIVP